MPGWTMSELAELLPRLRSREEYFDYLDGYSVRTADELRERRTTRGVGKTYMLETVGRSRPAPPLPSIFERIGLGMAAVEEGALYRISDPGFGGDVGLVELLHDRHPVLYTLLSAQQSDAWIRRVVQSTPWLDRLWLSARLFNELWRWVQATTNPRRFTQLKFDYEAFYETDEQPLQDEDDSALEATSEDAEDREAVARRSSRFTMADRVETIQARLGRLQEIYRPLYSITQLRVPAAGRGGHDFYFNGKVTNRSDSFSDHRQNVEFVLQTYRRVTERAEDLLWFASDDASPPTDGEGFRLRGAPVLLEFSERLSEQTFDRWIDTTFGRRANRFRLSGHPMRLSRTKVHVYGVDRHLWQPLMLELTDRHTYIVLPKGTCGNTVHRLVTNVQRFLDPGVAAWVGDQRFEDLVEAALPLPPRAA
jgi:hypothetical protein